MKKITKTLTAISLTLVLSVSSFSLLAQPGGVPDNPSLPSGGTGPQNAAVGHPNGPIGGASLVDGMWFLLLLGGVYAGYKVYQNKKDTELA